MIQKKCTEIHDTVRENENKEKWAVKGTYAGKCSDKTLYGSLTLK